jgi:ATP dependent DNA ligase-like protein
VIRSRGFIRRSGPRYIETRSTVARRRSLAIASRLGNLIFETAPTLRRLHRALHPYPRLQSARRTRLDPRGQHDGYRLQVRRECDAVRLFTRRGFDWTDRYPAIVRTALELPAKSLTLDGEAVVCGGDGIAVFEDLHRRGIVTEAMLYAFDLLEFGGEDLRPFPLSDRKRLVTKAVGKRSLGIVLSEHTDVDIFREEE